MPTTAPAARVLRPVGPHRWNVLVDGRKVGTVTRRLSRGLGLPTGRDLRPNENPPEYRVEYFGQTLGGSPLVARPTLVAAARQLADANLRRSLTP